MTIRYEHYGWSGGREPMLAAGPATGAQVLIVPPLFEEMNYLRAIMAGMARALADLGVGAWIMDLPGSNESDRSIEAIGWEDLRGAVAAAAETIAAGPAGAPHIASLRGGGLVDDLAVARSWWRFAGADGAAVLRQMERAQVIGDRESGRPPIDPDAATIDLIGYRLNRPLREALRAARPAAPFGPLREVPFAGPGVAPWRRAEPTADAALSGLLAEDIAVWIAACGA